MSEVLKWRQFLPTPEPVVLLLPGEYRLETDGEVLRFEQRDSSLLCCIAQLAVEPQNETGHDCGNPSADSAAARWTLS